MPADPTAYGLPPECSLVPNQFASALATFQHPDGHFTAVFGGRPSLTVVYTGQPAPQPAEPEPSCRVCSQPIPTDSETWDEFWDGEEWFEAPVHRACKKN